MRAAVAVAPGGPEVLQIQEIPTPVPDVGQVLIRVHAAGLNRAELFTRQGDSPGVRFPRVLGIEATGQVVAAPGGELAVGQRVVTLMGGMGRRFDGGYAEYTCVPAEQVVPVDSALPWAVLGALPEMFQTASGSLRVMGVQPGQTLLIRGGTSSVGLCAGRLAADAGVRVLATTRSERKFQALRDNGAEPVLEQPKLQVERVDHVLELIGATTLVDSLGCVRPGGVVCMTGILGGAWTLPDFEPMVQIPTGVLLTAYSGGHQDLDRAAFSGFVRAVEQGRFPVRLAPTFTLDQIQDAHRGMEANAFAGKVVLLPWG